MTGSNVHPQGTLILGPNVRIIMPKRPWGIVDPRRGAARNRKRPWGSGSIKWLPKRAMFECRVRIGGVQRSAYAKDERGAYEALEALRVKYQSRVAGDSVSVEWFGTGWLETIRSERTVATFKLYETTMRVHILPSIGSKRIEDLDADAVKAFMKSLRDAKVTPSRRRSAYDIASRMYSVAVRQGYAPMNPFQAMARDERPRVEKKRVAIPSKDEAMSLLEAAHTTPHYALIAVALNSGAREGELFALHWSDVHLDASTITIAHSLAETLDGKLARKSTKTGSIRSVRLPNGVVDVLRQHRATQKARGYTGDWVFPNSEGGPLRKSNFLRRDWHPLLEAAGLPRMRFHVLRHVANALLASTGAPLSVLQARGGWASSRMPLEVYGHLLDQDQDRAADSLEREGLI